MQRVFRKGQYLFHQGDAVVSMFLIEAGEARLLRRQRGGAAIVLQRALPGSFLAEASLFTASYHCDAIATTRISVRLISRTAMQKLFESYPALPRHGPAISPEKSAVPACGPKFWHSGPLLNALMPGPPRGVSSRRKAHGKPWRRKSAPAPKRSTAKSRSGSRESDAIINRPCKPARAARGALGLRLKALQWGAHRGVSG